METGGVPHADSRLDGRCGRLPADAQQSAGNEPSTPLAQFGILTAEASMVEQCLISSDVEQSRDLGFLHAAVNRACNDNIAKIFLNSLLKRRRLWGLETSLSVS
jgi:hypothetical protein